MRDREITFVFSEVCLGNDKSFFSLDINPLTKSLTVLRDYLD